MSRRVGVALAALAALAACGGKRGGGGGDDWVEVAPDAGGFRARFPAEPRERYQDLALGPKPHRREFLTLERPPLGRFEIAWSDFPDAVPDDPLPVLEQACKRPFAKSKLKLVDGRPAPLGERPGYLATGQAPPSPGDARLKDGAISWQRCVLAGRRLFQLSYLGPATDAGRAEAQRFFDAFVIERDVP